MVDLLQRSPIADAPGRTNCTLCGSPGKHDPKADWLLSLDTDEIPFRVLRCRNCRFAWLSPIPTPEEIEGIYDAAYYATSALRHSYDEQAQALDLCFEERAIRFRDLVSNGRLLDVGCATGEFLERAQDQGFETLGIELSEYAANKAQARGLNILRTGLEAAELDELQFDGIHISHVLEHLPDPVEAIRRVTALTRVGGVLYVEVPNQFDNILDQMNLLRRARLPYSALSIHHLSFFTPQSLKTMMRNAGLEVISVETYLPCRRTGRKLNARLALLRSGLWLADLLAERGDVIAIWARRKTP